MRKYLLIIFGVQLFALFGQYNFQMRVDTNAGLIGEPIQLDLQAVMPSNTNFSWPIYEDSVGPLEILRRTPLDTIDTAGQWVISQSFFLTQFDSGYYRIPPQAMAINQENKTDSLYTAALSVIYNTVAIDSTSMPYDIRRPLDVKYYYIQEIIIGFLILLLIAGLIFIYVKYYRKPQKVSEDIENQTPYDIRALEALNILHEEEAWKQWEQKPYYFELSIILRAYLEKRYGFLALESTTDSIKEALENIALDSGQKEYLIELLSDSDLVKFAKVKQSIESAEKAWHVANNFIEATRLKEELPSLENIKEDVNA